MRRKGNYFTKKMFEELTDLNDAIRNKEVEKASGGLYRGVNNEESRQWRRIPDLYNRSGAMKFINENTKKPLTLRQATDLGINVSMAVSSGFVRYSSKGLEYDDGKFQPTYQHSKKYDYSENVIARKGNIIPEHIFTELPVSEKLFKKEGGYYIGLVDDALSKVLTFENEELIGLPYIYLDQMYAGKLFKIPLSNIHNSIVTELIVSGHVMVCKDYLLLDNQDIKRHNFYNWVGRRIYCEKSTL